MSGTTNSPEVRTDDQSDQLRHQAPPERQIATADDRHLALTHNLGGYPGEMVSFVSILGTELE